MANFLSKKAYDPLKYWNARSDPNNDEGRGADRVKADVDYIQAHLRSATKILELGPGVGRTFAAYSAGLDVATLDISKRYIDELNVVAKNCGLSLKQYHLSDAFEKFPFIDGQFELGVCCQVLLHQPPDVFQHSISELGRVCQRMVLISGFHSTFPETASKAIKAEHVFSHDILAAVQNTGRTCHDVISMHRKIYICAE